MEFSYNALKKMDVVNVADGKHLGRVCDAVFNYPENRIQGFYVTGGKGFRFAKQDIFLPLSAIVRIGEDVVLTDLHQCMPEKGKRDKNRLCPPQGEEKPNRRNYDEYE
ncbi:MAG: PRC-barrel domain-containing protein [Clostridia bacterium]|nr:PRC-barrel domain-containing protein [Clostridia bacterium]